MAEPPRFYIFHGADEFTQKETLADLKARMGDDPAMVDLNTTTFDGRTVQMSELQHACQSIPFMSSKRLVIVEGLIERFKDDKSQREKLMTFLPQLPPSTRLVMLEKKALSPRNPFIKLAQSSTVGYTRLFEPPKGGALTKWIQQRVQEQEGSIHPHAAALLAANVGQDLRRLEMEITKLLTYVRLERAIEPADIFELVDAIGQKQSRKAATLLRRKLEEGDEPLYLLAMIIRQFRLLVQVKEKLEQNFRTDEIGRQIKLHPYVTGKIAQQAANFNLQQLEDIYQHLLDTDIAIKTGKIDPVLALDLLVVELAN